jgi:AAA domain-containing protein
LGWREDRIVRRAPTVAKGRGRGRDPGRLRSREKAPSEQLILDIEAATKEREQGCTLIIIDTISRALSGRKEDDEGMGGLITAPGRVQATIGCTVLGVHHEGKDASRGMRGHTGPERAADAVVHAVSAGTFLALVAPRIPPVLIGSRKLYARIAPAEIGGAVEHVKQDLSNTFPRAHEACW